MPEELKDLIEKIHEEGVRVAEEKANAIEEEARKRADEIIKKAKKEAETLISEAGKKVARMEESGKELLKQTGRDLLLTLKKEINAMLDRVVVSHVKEALSPDEIIKIITPLIKNAKGEEIKDITILLKKEDLEKIEKKLLNELRDETKKGITLEVSEEVHGGFRISYDRSKSYYDFTDKALAEYISAYLKPKVAEMLK